MNLHPAACEFYRLNITTEPPMPAAEWQASFDDGATWIGSTVLEQDAAWLVAGPDYDGGQAVVHIVTETTRPLVRAVVNPETVIREDVPRIVLT